MKIKYLLLWFGIFYIRVRVIFDFSFCKEYLEFERTFSKYERRIGSTNYASSNRISKIKKYYYMVTI